MIENLESIRNAAPNTKQLLSVTLDRSIVTIASSSYRDSSKGQNKFVFGSLSFEWGIVNRDKGRKRQDSFDLVGVSCLSRNWKNAPFGLV
jgi:hypothetical protein